MLGGFFMSINVGLLQCLKEDLISKLVVISSTCNSSKDNKSMVVLSKEKRFDGTFGKFKWCKLDILLIQRVNGENRPHHWEQIIHAAQIVLLMSKVKINYDIHY